MKFSELNKIEKKPNILEKGNYLAKIADAELRVSKEGKQNINIRLDVLTEEGKRLQSVWDVITDPDTAKEQANYKLQRLLRAVEANFKANEDITLTKVLQVVSNNDKLFRVDITIQNQDTIYPVRNAVDISNDSYYLVNETIEDEVVEGGV